MTRTLFEALPSDPELGPMGGSRGDFHRDRFPQSRHFDIRAQHRLPGRQGQIDKQVRVSNPELGILR